MLKTTVKIWIPKPADDIVGTHTLLGPHKHLLFESESESRFNSEENWFWFITRLLGLYHQKIHPAFPQKLRLTRHNDLCLDLLESIICLPVHCFF